ncbi:MAG: acyl-CoA dehydrogenase [Roseovarius sp.]|nr:acyl-CoA dehydrogenase [Roseovarius sp.]MBK45938.1 acyl-CoA dehydrogenase [Roseovarius sp.]|tara:strand:- start:4469 stop:5623 length:1155 start_codon:yes stop_codon:yes gene_type:complete
MSDEQKEIRENILRICAQFGDDYWLDRDRNGGFPHELYQAMADGGWLGIAMPESVGGADLGIAEATIMMQAVAESGAGASGASAIHMNIFGLNPVVRFGTDAQRARMLPPLIAGEQKACFAVTEPTTGLDTTKLKTMAVRQGDRYVVHGQKVWISTAQVAHKMLLLARTTPLEDVTSPTDGLSLFYTDLDRNFVDVREIEKMGRKAVDSNELFIDGLPIPADDLIGEEGKGFRQILHGLNPERILVAGECIGIARNALARAAQYANEREVFGRRIGQNQGVQHPLARAWAHVEAANLMVMHAAALYDAGESCGVEANAAKLLAADAAVEATEAAQITFGGFGYAKEYHVERLVREALLFRIVPVTPQMLMSFIAEKALGLPKSY